MTNTNYQQRLVVPHSPTEVYDALTRVTEWWTINADGNTSAEGDEFTVEFGEVHRSTQRIIEASPGRRFAWRVTESHLPWLADITEWTDTELLFDIALTREGTALTFTHVGLTPAVECYAQCEKGWDYFIGTSLRKLITEGTGQPDTTARTHMDTIGHVRPRHA